jgi:hypothetical protein
LVVGWLISRRGVCWPTGQTLDQLLLLLELFAQGLQLAGLLALAPCLLAQLSLGLLGGLGLGVEPGLGVAQALLEQADRALVGGGLALGLGGGADQALQLGLDGREPGLRVGQLLLGGVEVRVGTRQIRGELGDLCLGHTLGLGVLGGGVLLGERPELGQQGSTTARS